MNKLYTLCNNIMKKKKKAGVFYPDVTVNKQVYWFYSGISYFWLFLFSSLSQELDSNLETLTTAFEKATSEKLRFQEEVNRTNKTIELANRLVKGLEVGTAATNGRSV